MNSIYRLRRVGCQPSLPFIRDTYELKGENTLIGRSPEAHVHLDSSLRKGLISRMHAKIIAIESRYEISDCSLNGTYVNDVRIKGSRILCNGDSIAFGHIRGAKIEPGSYAPQYDTEFLFKFEQISMKKEEPFDEYYETTSNANGAVDVTSSVFMSPISPTFSETTLPATNRSDSSQDVTSPTLRSRKTRTLTEVPILIDSQEGDDSKVDIVSVITNRINNDELNCSQEFNVEVSPDTTRTLLNSPLEMKLQPVPEHAKLTLSGSRNVKEELSNGTRTTSEIANTSLEWASQISSELPTLRRSSRLKSEVIAYESCPEEAMKSESDDSADVKVDVKPYFSADEDDVKTEEDVVTDVELKSEPCALMKAEEQEQSVFHEAKPLQMKSRNDSESSESSEPDIIERLSDRSEEVTDTDEEYNPMKDETAPLNKIAQPLAALPKQRRRRTKRRSASNSTSTAENTATSSRQACGSASKKKYEHNKCAAWDCRRPVGERILWVQCDDCDGWYHVTCSGLSVKEARNKDTNYHCGCC